VAAVDAQGYYSTTVYDGAGRAIAQVNALGQCRTAVLDVSGTAVAQIDPLGYRMTTLFDAPGRPVCRVDAMGGMRTTVYDGFGRMAVTVDERGYPLTIAYDAFGRAAATQDALGYRVSSVFDAFGRITGALDPSGYLSTVTFDLLGRTAARMDALGFVETTIYDAAGQAQVGVDALGRRTTSVFDSAGRIVAVVNALGYRTTSSFDLRSSQVGATNPRGCQVTMVFDALGRQVASVDALGRRATSVFDSRGTIVQQADARGQTETRTYDALARYLTSQFADGTRATRVYDSVGQMVQTSNQIGVYTHTYDALGRQVSEVAPGYPSGMPVTSAYDRVGNRVRLVTWRGTQTYTYDPRSRMTVLADIEGGLTTWTYDGREMNTQQQNPNGTSTNIAYDGNRQCLTIFHLHPDGTRLDSALYTYDQVGNPLSLDRQDGDPYSYMYDRLNQILVQSDPYTGTKTWTYDPAGNRVTEFSNPGQSTPAISYWTTCTYDAADQQLDEERTGSVVNSSSTSIFNYDANGNRIQETKTQGFSTYLTTYSWDPSNRLAVVQDGSYVMTNTYRPDGMRHQMVDNFGPEVMVRDGNDVLAWVDGAGALGAFHTRGAKAVKTYSSPTWQHYYHIDALGTMQAYSNPDGTTYQRPVLDAWGGNAQAMGFDVCSFVGDLGYWGELDQLRRPLYYVRERWLVAGGPGWLSRDPAATLPLAAYNYVQSCPTRLVDPTGLVLEAVLGFDDSPRTGLDASYGRPQSTRDIMAVLQNPVVPGTVGKPAPIQGAFFVIGSRFDVSAPTPAPEVRDAKAGQQTVIDLHNLGHLLGNHTYCHIHAWWPPTGKDAARWQRELCRAHELVRKLTGYRMSYYRTPGLDWSSDVAGPVRNVLPGYAFLADLKNYPTGGYLALSVKTLSDSDSNKVVSWAAHQKDLDTFLQSNMKNPLGRVWIFMHDQPASNPHTDNPRGVTLLKLVIGYLRQKNITIANPPGEVDPGGVCTDLLQHLGQDALYRCPQQD
jgi:YD repeat-containing protein